MKNTIIKLWNRVKEQKSGKAWFNAIVACVSYILFIVWIGNYVWLILLPIVFDVFITKIIPWTWWKKLKNKTIVSVMGWVDALLFALVAVYFINTYLFQNYQIPTSSLEKSLLVGDFLFVSKASYGPRIPNTPLSFPLVQHTFPLINTKSYIDKPHWEYKRLSGFDSIKPNDIVVFNFPAGDTVPQKVSNPDYYTLCYIYGKQFVNNRKDIFGDIIYRPVDRRENYVKRCVAIAGNWLQIKNNQVYVNGEKCINNSGIQFNYYIQTDGTLLNREFVDELGISVADDSLMIKAGQSDEINSYNANEIMKLGLNPNLPVYHFPLNEEMYNNLLKTSGITKLVIEKSNRHDVFPLGGNKSWTRDNYGPIWIPRKGAVLKLNAYNYSIYERIIRNYENNTLERRGGKFFINNKQTDVYKFKMDYYWMLGDNRHNSADSRYWGFVPEDHIVGRPVLVWLSLNKDKSWFDGKIRWNRFLKNAEE